MFKFDLVTLAGILISFFSAILLLQSQKKSFFLKLFFWVGVSVSLLTVICNFIDLNGSVTFFLNKNFGLQLTTATRFQLVEELKLFGVLSVLASGYFVVDPKLSLIDAKKRDNYQSATVLLGGVFVFIAMVINFAFINGYLYLLPASIGLMLMSTSILIGYICVTYYGDNSDVYKEVEFVCLICALIGFAVMLAVALI